MKKNKIIIENILLSYFDNYLENKKTLLFLHGWGCSADTMLSLAQKFTKTHRVLLLDLPGFGESEITPHGLDLKSYTQIIFAFLKKLKLNSINIIGHSFGGRIGIYFAFLYPQELSSLTLINNGGIKNNSWKIKFIKKIAQIGKFLKLHFFRDLFYKIFITENDALQVKDNLAMRKTFKKIVEEDLQKKATKIQIKTLILWGEKDTETPLWQGKIWKKLIKNSIMFISPGDHFFFLKNSNWVYEKLVKFLD